MSVGSETLPILMHVAVSVSKRAANPLLQNLPWPKTASLVIFLLFLKFPYFEISHLITEASERELYGTQTDVIVELAPKLTRVHPIVFSQSKSSLQLEPFLS